MYCVLFVRFWHLEVIMEQSKEELELLLAKVKERIARLEEIETKLFHMRAIARAALGDVDKKEMNHLQSEMNRLDREIQSLENELPDVYTLT